MGLDWIARAKEDGVSPYQTLGMRRVSVDDKETIEVFRGIWQSHHDNALGTNGTNEYKEYWLQPFETVLAATLADEEPPFVEVAGTIKVPGSGGSFAVPPNVSFRGKMLQFCGLGEDLVQRFFGDDQCMISPETALDIAYQMRRALEAGLPDRRADDDEPVEAQRETITEGIGWLEFWANRGHPIWAWY